MKKILLLLAALFMFGITVKAECLEKEYIDWAYDLEPVFTVFNYNDHSDLDIERYKYAYFLSLSKQRDDITFSVIDKYNNKVPAENFEELKIYGVGLYNGIDEETYKIEVYGNAKGTCNGQLITTLSYTVPQFNEFYKTQYCDKYKDHELCQVYTNATKDMTFDEFKTAMEEYEEGNSKNIFKKVWKFLASIWVYLLCIIIPIVGVSIYYNVKIKRYKKMRNRHEDKRIKYKKNINLFIVLLLCLTAVRVNASLVCGDATIKEGAITSAGWSTRLIMCDWYDTGDKTKIGGGPTYDSAVKAGEQLVAKTVWAADGKSSSEIMVPMCIIEANGGPGIVEAEVTHHFWYKKYECVKNCETNESVSDWVDKQGECTDKAEVVTEDIDINKRKCSGCAQSYYGCNSDKPEVKYYVRCPIYACKPVEKTVEGWCNATFKVGNDPAYCVNPSDKFPDGIPNNYQTQDFDPTKCKSSNSTPDCGFANIMIEAAYYNTRHPNNKISYETINMALRLWSGEVDLGGFYRVGLAYMMGFGCSEYVVYPAGNPNVYLATLKYITRLYFEAISKEGVDHSVESLINSNYFENIACKPGQLGVVCQGQTNTYKQAFALYFNTYFGNEDMQNHLANMFGDRETEPISATVSSEVVDEYSVVEVKYLEEVTIGEKIECSDIKKKKNKGETLTLNEEKVLSYCNNQITRVIGVKPDGTMVDLATGTIIRDFNGDGVINQKDFISDKLPQGDVYDFTYCQKNSCFSPTVYFAICDTVKKEEERYETIYTVIKYTESASTNSIKKYMACGSGDYQIMFSYDDQGTPGKTWEETKETKKDPVKTVAVEFYCYDEGGCSNYSLRQEKSCDSDTGGYVKASIKDPSLSCIVNMQSPVAKNSYDYSDFFGVNGDFCKIYCSDTAEFYMADKVDIYSGLSFKLDIEGSVFKNNKTTKPISSIVLMKRDCVSKIFYDNNNFESGTDWTKIYHGLETNPKNWKELYEKLKKYGEAEGHINQIKYDLYNCNLYSSDNIPKSVYKPKDNKIGNVYERIIQIYSADNSYGFDGNKYGYNTGNTDDDHNKLTTAKNTVVASRIKYEGGAYYVNSKTRVGADYDDIQLKHVINNHTGWKDKNGKSTNVSEVQYCKGPKCFAYNSENEYEMPKNGTGSTVSKTQGSSIPTNDYAYFSIVDEVDFYNASEFQVEPYTGSVYDISKKGKESKYTDLDKYLYPVGKDANVNCSKGSCKISYRFEISQTFYRKIGNGTNAFKNAISSAEFNENTCPIAYKANAVPVENKSETIYRNVDLSNMFPTIQSDGSRRIGPNWENSTAYVEEIENYVNANGAAKYYRTNVEYSYTLSRDSINKVKEYNSQSAGSKTYVDNTIEPGSCTDINGQKFNCRSSFISEINNNTNRFGIINNRAGEERGVSEYTQSKKQEG